MKKTAPQAKDMKGLAKTSLMDSLGAVSATLSAMPDNVVRMPTNLAEAFILIDPALSILHRQLADARRNNAQLAALFGQDPMIEALDAQIAALERAYDERLAALRRKREEGRLQAPKKINEFKKVEDQKRPDVRRPYGSDRKNNDTLWLWAFLMLIEASRSSATKIGLRLDAA